VDDPKTRLFDSYFKFRLPLYPTDRREGLKLMLERTPTTASSAKCEFAPQLILRLRRMSASTGRTAAWLRTRQGRLWEVHIGQIDIGWQDRRDAAKRSCGPIGI